MEFDKFSLMVRDVAAKALLKSNTCLVIDYSTALVFAVCQYASLYPESFRNILSNDLFQSEKNGLFSKPLSR